MVFIRGLSGWERDQYESLRENPARSTGAWLVARAVINPATGERLFTDADAVALEQKSAIALRRIIDAVHELSGLSPTAFEVSEQLFHRRPERRFYFRLARDLGMTVRRLLSELDSRELTEWMAYYRIEHLGDHPDFRADLRMALGTATLANHWREKKPLKAEDLMPRFERPEQSPEQLHAALSARAERDKARAERAARKAPADGDPGQTVRRTRPAGQGVRGRARQGGEEGR